MSKPAVDGRSARPKVRKYYQMTYSLSKNPVGLILENENEVSDDSRLPFGVGDPWRRGFSHFPNKVTPLFRHKKKEGRKPLDLESLGGYWLITDRTKAVFDAVDPSAFAYMPCEITYEDGSPTDHAWICDVVRLKDALDEEKSDATVRDGSRKRYALAGSRRLVFRDDAVGRAHIFRIAYAPGTVICDNVMRQACKDAELKSVTFIDAVRKAVDLTAWEHGPPEPPS